MIIYDIIFSAGDFMKRCSIKSIVIMVFGLTLMFLGASRGETDTVLEKAIRICLECIGVG